MIVWFYTQDSAYRATTFIMKIKLAYPKIPDTLGCPLKQCIAFEKYDGTNIHWVWKPDNGFVAFGTRRDQFDMSPNGIREFEQAHLELSYETLFSSFDPDEKLKHLFQTNSLYKGVKEIIVFTEYFGPNSFTGSHRKGDPMQSIIIDVQIDGVMVPPELFYDAFNKHCNIARIVFEGKFTGQLFIDVRKGKYDVKEGVVVKGMAEGQVYMAKIKTEAYLEKLKSEFKDNWKEYWE